MLLCIISLEHTQYLSHPSYINKYVVQDTNLQEMNKLYTHSINTLAFQSADSMYIQLYVSTHAESKEILTHQI